MVKLWLDEVGHHCHIFATGRDFMRAIQRDSFDLLILDWLLPDISGIEVLGSVRQRLDWHIPVLFVTRMDSEDDIVRALEQGADDYMTKPVQQRVLLARLHALDRRSGSGANDSRQPVLELPPFRLVPAEHRIERDGEPVELTQKEYELALFLFRNEGRILSRGHILESIWGTSPNLNTRTVDTHASRLRQKLKLQPEHGWRLSAVYQHGYRLECLESNENAAE